MRTKISVAIFGLALLCASQGLAGTTGNGWAQRNGAAPAAKTYYSYCFGGLRKVVYFSGVIQSAPTPTAPDLGGPFGQYVTKTYGVGSNDGGQCITSEAMADAVNGKKQREADFVSKAWKIIETNSAGH